MDEAPYSRDTDAEQVPEAPGSDEPAAEAPPEPAPDRAAESSFDQPVEDVEETLAAEQEPDAEPTEEPESAEEPQSAQEAEPSDEPQSAQEEEPSDELESSDEPAPSEERDPSIAPELVLEPEPAPAPATESLTLDDMVAEIAQSQGDEPAPDVETVGSEAAESEGAEPREAESEATETEAAAGEAAEAGGESAEEGAAEPSEELAEEEAGTAPALARQRMQTRIPFWAYGGVWVVFVGVMTYLIWPSTVTRFTDQPLYAYFVLGGAALAVIGLLVGLFAWFAGRSGASAAGRQGLTQAILLRTAGWMAVGVALWWIALMSLDLHRTGVIR